MSGRHVAEFYDLDPVSQVAVNLFYGWGYNFYRQENQLRADDLLVRHQVAGILGEARLAIDKAESSYREDHLPPLSRANPRPDPTALKQARVLETLVGEISAVAARIRAQPVPENDRIAQRHRQEADTLMKLLHADMALVGHADLLKRTVRDQPPEWLVAHAGEVKAHVGAITAALSERAAILNL